MIALSAPTAAIVASCFGDGEFWPAGKAAHRHAALLVRTTFPKSLRGAGRCDWPRSASNRRKKVGSVAAGALLRRLAASGRGEHGVG